MDKDNKYPRKWDENDIKNTADMHQKADIEDGAPVYTGRNDTASFQRGVSGNSSAGAKKKPKLLLPIIIGFLFIIGGGGLGFYLWNRPSQGLIPLETYYEHYNPEDYSLVYNDKWFREDNPVKSNEFYIPVLFIKNHIDTYIFEDYRGGRVTITTENKVIRMGTQELNYFINDEPMAFDLPIINQDKQMYLALSMVEELYDVTIEIHESEKIIIIDDLSVDKEIGQIMKDGYLRYEAHKKSPSIRKTMENETVILYDTDGDYTRVRTREGYFGYILSSQITQGETIFGETREEIKARESLPMEKPVVLAFDLVGSVKGNESKQYFTPDVNVLSPTWFTLDADKMNGELLALASKSYVDFAHENGYQVWGLFSDSFNAEVCHLVLTDTSVRETVIRQLLAYAAMYDLDGINIDLERVTAEDKDYYIQFFRELYPFMKAQGLVLSVDIYVPAAHNLHYSREEVAKTVDYVIIMAYDEHYSGSPVAGPVASLPFVRKGVLDTLKEVPKEKIIMAMPYYSRMWREVEAGGAFTINSPGAYGMNTAKDKFTDQGADFFWDETIGSYYAAFDILEDTEMYKQGKYMIWLENPASIEKKLEIALEHEVEGIAMWYRGLESEEAWPVISAYVEAFKNQ